MATPNRSEKKSVDVRVAKRIVSSSKLSDRITKVTYLKKGYSTDKKYILWVGDEPHHLLRLSNIAEEPRRRNEFDMQAQLYNKGVACPEAIDFGVSEDDGVCFSILGFVSGKSARGELPRLSKSRQYTFGLQAGRELYRIHNAMIPPLTHIDWQAHRSARYHANTAIVHNLGLTFPGQAEIEQFVENNLSLLANRPITFLHADYHPGNLIMRNGGLAGVIDFNRCTWGDPFFEFYKTAQFGAPLSFPYARGQVKGYFDGDPPAEFWSFYNLYVAMVLNGHLAWIYQYYPNEIPASLKLIKHILNTHDLMGGTQPVWYMPQENSQYGNT